MSRPVPLARLQRVQQIQSRLSAALGVSNGVAVQAAAEPDAEGITTAELWLYGIVGSYWFGFSDKTVADQLRGLNVDHLTVRINSPGGDAIQGIAIGNLLRNHKAAVTVVVDGLAASSASIIAVAGDEVVMSPGSQMMVHDPWMFTLGNAKELRQDADFLDKQGANLAGVYAHETGGTPQAWRAVMTAEPDGTWYSADEAVAANLADRVGTVVAVGAAPAPPAPDPEDDGFDDLAARAAWDLEVAITPAARAAWGVTAPTPKTPDDNTAAGNANKEGETAVAFSDEQLTTMRQQLGVDADADEATILDALGEALAEQAEDPGSPAAPAAPSNPTAGLPDGVVAIDADVLAQLQAGAAAGEAAGERQRVADRDAAITAAFRAGKIAATSREKFEAAWDKDPESTRAILDSLTPGLIPVAEVGHESEPGSLGAGIEISDAELDAFAASLGISKEALHG